MKTTQNDILRMCVLSVIFFIFKRTRFWVLLGFNFLNCILSGAGTRQLFVHALIFILFYSSFFCFSPFALLNDKVKKTETPTVNVGQMRQGKWQIAKQEICISMEEQKNTNLHLNEIVVYFMICEYNLVAISIYMMMIYV